MTNFLSDRQLPDLQAALKVTAKVDLVPMTGQMIVTDAHTNVTVTMRLYYKTDNVWWK